MHLFDKSRTFLYCMKRKTSFSVARKCFHQSFLQFRNNWAKVSHSVLPNGHLNDDERSHVDSLYKGLISGNRASLAQAITLVESTHSRKRLMARDLLTRSLRLTATNQHINKSNSLSFRIGLSGPPGAGKSTFLESMGMHLLDKGKKVAILAVDPSSTTHGGSLLGDKTRMPELSRDLRAFVRPSPTGGHLGGVTRSTNEAILMCEAAGYNIIFIETVGVGQSEYAVADMVDLFVLLIPPAGGDELQGLKRGIMERSHIVVVNKADGSLAEAAMRMQYEYMSALKFMRPVSPHWRSQVVKISSLTKEGLPELWKMMEEYQKIMIENGELLETRKKQRRVWMWNYITTHIIQVFRNDPRVQRHTKELEEQVEEGVITAGEAAEVLLHYFTSDALSECS